MGCTIDRYVPPGHANCTSPQPLASFVCSAQYQLRQGSHRTANCANCDSTRHYQADKAEKKNSTTKVVRPKKRKRPNTIRVIEVQASLRNLFCVLWTILIRSRPSQILVIHT